MYTKLRGGGGRGLPKERVEGRSFPSDEMDLMRRNYCIAVVKNI